MTRNGNSFPATATLFEGSAISRALRPHPAHVEQFVGVIRNAPASDRPGADYSDARYYIDRAVPAPDSSCTKLLTTTVDTLAGIRGTITATNLAEVADNTHLLPSGTLVQVFALYARGGRGAKVYVFNRPPVQTVIVQITSAAPAGEYNGKILSGGAAASSGTAFTMPAGMSAPASEDALVLNLEESALSGHRLANGSYALGVVRGSTGDTPPRSIVVIRGGVGRTDSPTTLGSASAGSETADGATWSKASDATPVNVYVVSRVVYNPSGDQALYSFVRMMSFDARGLLVSVGAETRVTVDTTEACS